MRLFQISLIVPDYDAAIGFYRDQMGFELIEDTDLGQGKRWVVVRPGTGGADLLLARAADDVQATAIGNQAGGRVFLFLDSDDFNADFTRLKNAGVEFLEDPRRETYGSVAVFCDPFGNKWDLIEREHPH